MVITILEAVITIFPTAIVLKIPVASKGKIRAKTVVILHKSSISCNVLGRHDQHKCNKNRENTSF